MSDVGIGYKYCFVVKKIYYEDIIKGNKTVEGRIADRKRTYMKLTKNDIIAFRPGQGAKIGCFAKIKDVQTFDTFENMLNSVGFSSCLPNCRSVEEGVNVYRSINNYANEEIEKGVVALSFRIIPFQSNYRRI